MFHVARGVALGIVCLMAVTAWAQGPQTPGRNPGPGGPAGRGPQPPRGPWENDVHIFHVTSSGDAEQLATIERAGVPTLARLADGRFLAAFQYFPKDAPEQFDRVAIADSSDNGRTWSTPRTLHIEGFDAGLVRPFDPTLVPLPDGRLRIYFTSNRSRDLRVGAPAIYSAISDDGREWRFEPGVRFAVEGRMIIDCAVVLHAGQFHLFAPDNGPAGGPGQGGRPAGERDRPRLGVGYHAVSTDGLNFQRVADVRVEGRRRWLGNAQSDGQRITFAGTEDGDPARGGRGGVWLAVSSDAITWELQSVPTVRGADPGLAAAGNGGWIVAVTSTPVPGREQDGPPRNGFRPVPRPNAPSDTDRNRPGF